MNLKHFWTVMLGSSLALSSLTSCNGGDPVPTPSPTPAQTPPPETTPSLPPTSTPVTTTPTVAPTTPPADVDEDEDGFTDLEGDCDDGDPDIYPTATEVPYDGIDQDCSGDDLTDVDGDGYPSVEADGTDCDDDDIHSYPGAEEVGDGKDNDCNGEVDDGLDTTDDDLDGFSEAEGDCDDTQPLINPEAEEIPYNGVDEDCSGQDLTDVDGDGVPGGQEGGDCQDEDAGIRPGFDEVPYDGIDQNCDGLDLTDVDGDGVDGGPSGEDCDDTDPARAPGMEEVAYDGLDQDCDGTDLDDLDADGFAGPPESGPDCDDQSAEINPAAEEIAYDGIDQDCSGQDLNDIDGDGYPALEAGGKDCDDGDQNSFPGASEVGDGKDNDCDGSIDEGLNTTDDDGDGYAESTGDCNDASSSIHPGATEVAYDGIDQDCSGLDLTDVDGDGYAGGSSGSDCNDSLATVYPGATETPYDGIDQDCAGGDLTDVDRDGFASVKVTGGKDCDDGNPLINPTATETPYDGIDQDCSGKDTTDVDGDGFDSTYVSGGTDCNDYNPGLNPGSAEKCDGIDNNCDGVVDTDAIDRLTFYPDADHDGYGDGTRPALACTASSTQVANGADCDDSSASAFPGGLEVCDTLDNDCNGEVDEGVTTTYFKDGDGDGYGDADATTEACSQPLGYVSDATDCDDSKASVRPGGTEACNLVDDDCDAEVDEGVKLTFYADADEDGYGNPGKSTQACSAPAGYVANNTDCKDSNDAIHPNATETCNNVDDDCDGTIDDGAQTTYYQDADNDLYGNASVSKLACSIPAGYVLDSRDCDDSKSNVNPGAAELCDGLDNDCDSSIDEGVKKTFYADGDGDSYGSSSQTTQACSVPNGYTDNGLDCDDTKSSVHPFAAETCNSIDDDCDGVADDGLAAIWYKDADGDGYGTASVTSSGCAAPAGFVSLSGDCNDGAAAVNPGATEVCDASNLDEDCDGAADDGDSSASSSTKTRYYPDADKDGYGAQGNAGALYCDNPSTSSTKFSLTNNDCNDSSASVYPGATELCNGADEDCDGTVDDGATYGGPGSTTFSYTGGEQTFTVPACVTSVTITAYGAEGNRASTTLGYVAGKGGMARGTLAVTPGQVLRVYVGGQNGYNGGGAGWGTPAANGGGASDVRVGGAAVSNRVIVAGGGGGVGGESNWGSGGNGGGGSCGANYCGGAGGGGYAYSGTPGGSSGGTSSSNCHGGGGGGGGLNGGGGGSTTTCYTTGKGGDGTQDGGGAGWAPTNGCCQSYGVGGGGGGYYGGGAASGGCCGGGGGGGGASWTGTLTSASFSAGTRTGHGQVIVAW